jgi:hypothetical protein
LQPHPTARHARIGGLLKETLKEALTRMRVRFFLCLLLVLIAGITVIAVKPPLSDVHFDSPYYLYQSKRLVETPFYSSYLQHADEVAREVVDKSWDKNLSYFPQRYWYFSRLGHITTLAGFVALGGTGRDALLWAHWGFGVLLAISLCVLVAFTLQLMRLFGFVAGLRPSVAGAGISGVLFAASGQYWHLAGNFVTEVPAIFYLSISLLALVTCLSWRPWLFGALAGLTAFLVYESRPDFLWVIVVFCILVLVFSHIGKLPRIQKTGLFAAGVVALSAWGLFAWFFWPMTDPRLYLRFVGLLHLHNEQPSLYLRLFTTSGGLLWVGFVLAIWKTRFHPFIQFGLLWLILSVAPWIVQAFSGTTAQSRMFSLTLPALLILSSAGWALLLQTASNAGSYRANSIAAPVLATLILLALTHPATYSLIRDLPGGWRLQYPRSFLWPDPWENRNYYVDDLARISDALYQDGDLKIVLLDASAQKDVEFVNVVRFLGPVHKSDMDPLLEPEPQKVWRLGNYPKLNGERVAIRSYSAFNEEDLLALRQGRYRLFVLGRDRVPEHLNVGDGTVLAKPVVQGEKYWLSEALGPW